jgi:hypothetical protein
VAAMPLPLIEPIADELRVDAADGLVAVDAALDAQFRRGGLVALVQRLLDELPEHGPQLVARVADGREKTDAGLIGADAAHDLAAHGDLVAAVVEAQLAARDVDLLEVLQARAENARLADRYGGVAERSGKWGIEPKPLELSPLLTALLHERGF